MSFHLIFAFDFFYSNPNLKALKRIYPEMIPVYFKKLIKNILKTLYIKLKMDIIKS